MHLDGLNWDLLSHGTTWGERGAHEPVAQQGYRHSGPCESPPIPLWPHTAPQCGSALHWGRLAKSSTWQKPGPALKSRLKPALSWQTGAKKGLAGLQGSERKGKATAAFVQLPGMVQECLGPSSSFLAPPRYSTEDVGGEGPALPMLSQPCKDHLTAPSRTARAQMPRPAGPRCLHTPEPSSILHSALREQLSHPACGLKDITVPYTGIRDHWATRWAPQSCRGLQPSLLTAKLFSSRAEAQQRKLPSGSGPVSRGKSKGCQRPGITSHLAQTGHLPTHHTTDTHIHYSLSSSRSQGKSSPLAWDHAVCLGPQQP